jgi:uncharacterized RDD family membrane protein YckC
MTDKKVHTSAMPTPDDDEITLSGIHRRSSKTLKLDDKNYRPAKTRAELYREMQLEEEVEIKDIYDFANPYKRGSALVIDLAFIYIVISFALLLAPYELSIAQHFLDLYKHEFIFARETMVTGLDILNTLAAIFFMIIVPLSFFNCSLGKKLMRLRVRGDQTYTISITKAFQREIIFKPISMILIVGFIMPFRDPNSQSLHDKMAGTLVIKD